MSRPPFPLNTGSRYGVLLAAVLVVAGCASHHEQDADMDAETRRYVRNAAIGDMFEIESSRVALDRASSSEVRAFAQMMVDDHGSMSQKLEDAVDEAKLPVDLPDDLDGPHQAMLDQLEDADAANFDQLYTEMQTKAHRDGLLLHQTYSQSGDVPELRALATDAVPVIERHLMAADTLP